MVVPLSKVKFDAGTVSLLLFYEQFLILFVSITCEAGFTKEIK
jgi:hypothetical protein